jgi:dolichol-phosphate mannosyltransferase
MSSIAYPEAPSQMLSRTGGAPPAASLPVELEAANLFVIPAFNEEENLPRLFADLESRPQLLPPGSRVIIVDDGSNDGTVSVVERYDGPLPIELVKLNRNQGPGAAFRAGFGAALFDCTDDALVVTLEADTTSDLDALPAMLERAAAGAELVLASVHGGGEMVNVNRSRRILSAGAGFAVRHALGVNARTVSSFFRVYRAGLLRTAVTRYGDRLIQERGFACKAELLAKLTILGARIEEVPVDVDGAKRNGDSKMRVLPTFLAYWRMMARHRVAKEWISA